MRLSVSSSSREKLEICPLSWRPGGLCRWRINCLAPAAGGHPFPARLSVIHQWWTQACAGRRGWHLPRWCQELFSWPVPSQSQGGVACSRLGNITRCSAFGSCGDHCCRFAFSIIKNFMRILAKRQNKATTVSLAQGLEWSPAFAQKRSQDCPEQD